MCTAATYRTKDFYFGRNLDYEHGYGESVTVVPRNYPFSFREAGDLPTHYAMIGMAMVQDGYPLFYDGTNEKGLSMAGLNFVGNAVYHPLEAGKDNIAQFELIPWVLGKCATVAQAKDLLSRLNITNTPFCPGMPLAQLHWLIADKEDCITLESTQDGLFVYDNPAGVLTNNPPFPVQLWALSNYPQVSAKPPVPRSGMPFTPYSRGLGGLGLPGDLSSQSRFVRCAFTRANSRSPETERESVSQFFHILRSVEQQRGCCELESGEYEITLYTSCCNADKGIYYYTTYEDTRIRGIDLHREDLEGSAVVTYPLVVEDPAILN